MAEVRLTANGDDDDGSYEYEYDTVETESFLIDLDFTSLNDQNKTRLSKLQKSSRDQAPQKTTNNSKTGEVVNQADTVSVDTSEVTTSQNDLDKLETFQILDLDSHNPIIAYRGQIYSCSWADMIGTNMFFTQHDEDPTLDPVIATPEYDLLGVSRIKLAGHRAKFVEKPQSKKRRRGEMEDEASNDAESSSAAAANLASGKSFGALRTPNPKVNREVKQQAQFLEKLMELKQKRGEKDTVRTFVNQQIAAVDASKKLDKNTVVRKEIDDLNRQVVRGNAKALARLQEIYSQLDDDDDEADADAAAAAADDNIEANPP